jgi:hypothetical protein
VTLVLARVMPTFDHPVSSLNAVIKAVCLRSRLPPSTSAWAGAAADDLASCLLSAADDQSSLFARVARG